MCTLIDNNINFDPIQDGRQKSSRTSFYPVTSTSVAFNPQSILTFSFNPFCHNNLKFLCHTYCQSQIIELERRVPLGKIGFSGQVSIKLRL